jgi:hypothetical protein
MFTKDFKGKKFVLILFFPKELNRNPLKFEKWINEYSLQQGQTQRFLKKAHPLATYFNLYEKESGKFYQQHAI